MVKFYQNRELSGKFGINLAKWKRWSREFLPPDPLGGMQSGYARQYNLDDALRVYLGGYLVASLRFSIPEARQILGDLKEWMLGHHFYYYFDHINLNGAGEDKNVGEYEVYIYDNRKSPENLLRFHYRIKEILSSTPLPDVGRNARREDYDEAFIGMSRECLEEKEGKQKLEVFLESKVLYISRLYRRFMESLEMDVQGSAPDKMPAR